MSAEHREQLMDALERAQNAHLLAIKEVQTPEMTFQEAWDAAKSQYPSLFTGQIAE